MGLNKPHRLGTQHSKMSFFSWVFTIPKWIPLSSFTATVPIFIISRFMLMILSLQRIIPHLWPPLLSSWVTCFPSRIWFLFIFFLGIEVIPTRTWLFLSQHKYVRELLDHISMSSEKDVSTPLSTTQSLQLVDGTTAVDSSEFRRIIGSLQYISLTRPDISFAVNKLS